MLHYGGSIATLNPGLYIARHAAVSASAVAERPRLRRGQWVTSVHAGQNVFNHYAAQDAFGRDTVAMPFLARILKGEPAAASLRKGSRGSTSTSSSATTITTTTTTTSDATTTGNRDLAEVEIDGPRGRERVSARSLSALNGIGVISSKYLDLLVEAQNRGLLRLSKMRLCPTMPAHELWSTKNHARCSPRCRRLVRLLLLIAARRGPASRFPRAAEFRLLFVWLSVPRDGWLGRDAAAARSAGRSSSLSSTVAPHVALSADESLPSPSPHAAALGCSVELASATTWHRQQRRVWLAEERRLLAGAGGVQGRVAIVRLELHLHLSSRALGTAQSGGAGVVRGMRDVAQIVHRLARYGAASDDPRCVRLVDSRRVIGPQHRASPWGRSAVDEAQLTRSSLSLGFGSRFSLQRLMGAARPSAAAPPHPAPPADLTATLLPFQSQALRWLESVESGEHARGIGAQPHYIWRPLLLPSGETLYQSRSAQHVLVTRAGSFDAPELPRGGILADEMGLGKTVTIIALILARRRPVEELARATFPNTLKWRAGVPRTVTSGGGGGGGGEGGARSGGARRSQRVALLEVDVGERYARVPAQPIAATLVVAPQTLITQWQGELRQHAPSLRVLTYRGMDGAVWARTFGGVDVVLTSYEQLRREMPRGTRTEKWSSPLLHCEWWRIVLDEAQTVSSGKSNTAVMSALLERQHSWCVSGTPLANSIADLRGLLNFLWFRPFVGVGAAAQQREAAAMFRHIVADPVRDARLDGAHTVEALLRTCMWRVLKADVADCLALAPCNVRNEWVALSALERAHYDRRHEEGCRLIRSLACRTCGKLAEHSEVCARGQRLEASALAAESGAAPSAKRRRREERGGAGPERTARAHRVGRMLLQLRQACCHPRVVSRTASGGGGAALPRGVASSEATMGQIAAQMCAAAQRVYTRELRAHARALARLAAHPASRGREALISADRVLRIVGMPSDLAWARLEFDALTVIDDAFGRYAGSDASSVAPAPSHSAATAAVAAHFAEGRSVGGAGGDGEHDGERCNWWMDGACRKEALRRHTVSLRLGDQRAQGNAAAAARLARARRASTAVQSAASRSVQAQNARTYVAQQQALRVRVRRCETRAASARRDCVEIERSVAAAQRSSRSALASTASSSSSSFSAAAASAPAPAALEALCPLCDQEIERPCLTRCGHVFCEPCLRAALVDQSNGGAATTCPTCRVAVDSESLFAVSLELEEGVEEEEGAVATTSGGAADAEAASFRDRFGSKLARLVALLRGIEAREPGAQAVVFSTWGRVLRLAESALDSSGIAHCALGSGRRGEEALARFRGDASIAVLFVPLRRASGATGLTLTNAHFGFILEASLATALEEQAIGRLWRIGQRSAVTIYRLVSERTVERGILQLQEQRRRGGGSTAATRSEKEVERLREAAMLFSLDYTRASTG